MTAPPDRSRVRVLRVIARLNMGGPALHVAYLTEGLAKRGYETTLVAGTLARGEDSMQFVAERHGVEVVRVDELHREISPLRDVVAAFRLATLLAGRARPRIVVHTFHGHVLRGYFGPVRTGFFRLLERVLARVSTRLIAVSPEVR